MYKSRIKFKFITTEADAFRWGTLIEKFDKFIIDKPTDLPLIIGLSIGGSLLLIALIIGGIWIYRKKTQGLIKSKTEE